MKDKILENHIKEVKTYMKEVGIDPNSRFTNEFIKQTRLLFKIYEELEKLKKTT